MAYITTSPARTGLFFRTLSRIDALLGASSHLIGLAIYHILWHLLKRLRNY